MPNEKPYREGDQQDPEPEPAAAPEVPPEELKEEPPKDPEEPKKPYETPKLEQMAGPVTAFLVLVQPNGRVDAVTDLPPTFKRMREATLRDVRDATQALHDDIQLTMIIRGATEELGKTMAKATEKHLVSMIQQKMSKGSRS